MPVGKIRNMPLSQLQSNSDTGDSDPGHHVFYSDSQRNSFSASEADSTSQTQYSTPRDPRNTVNEPAGQEIFIPGPAAHKGDIHHQVWTTDAECSDCSTRSRRSARIEWEEPSTTSQIVDEVSADVVADPEREIAPAFVGMWSRGSAGHDRGECMPCTFVQGKRGCRQGEECPFCHMLGHTIKNRPSKSKRAAMNRKANELDSLGSEELASRGAELATTECRYMKNLVNRKLKELSPADEERECEGIPQSHLGTMQWTELPSSSSRKPGGPGG
eukprot:gnl/TRDRNA2_/TRDRNA2_202116_c0_seq1.p1 gnl/TRDRNA2_/TRDRNA2_202116_c0~~gnl/TRDRNA2_/TRDRNA2_202116_c0_seq1.p1  ORF type:complete len:304 (-),score=15.83 gnl/TRDRNA2_/TRDRNA2_202116_c0_seq1:56-874(-)